MLTLNDIINISFRKANFSGYRTEDVDVFIDQVKESFEELIQKSVKLKENLEKKDEEVQQLQKKMEELAAKVEEYRNEEDEIKNVLVSAQKLGDASIRESRHKAEIIVKDATIKAERIVSSAKNDVVEQQKALEHLKKSATEFRAQLLSLYKEHLTMLNAFPAFSTESPKQEEKKAAPSPVSPPPEKPAMPTVPAVPVASEMEEDFEYHLEIANFDEEVPQVGKEPADKQP